VLYLPVFDSGGLAVHERPGKQPDYQRLPVRPMDYASATAATTHDVRADSNDADFSMYFALLARPAGLATV
jgi:hypothetical protein